MFDAIVSDNYPSGSREFEKFADDWHFTVTLFDISQNYAESNRLAKKAVEIEKIS